jgi:hypothetical protein
MSMTLADRLRDIAAHLPPLEQHDVLAVAVQVARLEVMLDEQVDQARLAALAVPRIRRTRCTDPRS